MISRRRFSLLNGAGLAAAFVWQPSVLANTVSAGKGADPRLVLIVLRGGLDGLAAVPAYADGNYRKARGELALEPPEKSGSLDLDGFFGLHPSLAGLHDLYQEQGLLVVHGVAPPYAGRSHFEGQDVLECGVANPSGSTDGWLYRALSALPGPTPAATYAMAIGAAVPRVLQGAKAVGAWSPDRLPDPDVETMQRILALYDEDEVLGPMLRASQETRGMLDGMGTRGRRRDAAFETSMRAAARFLRNPDGPRIAVLESTGWDTHANQGAVQGQLANRLSALDSLLSLLRSELGSTWQETVVLVATEFGRTVKVNGTRGSDHGVGGAAFVLGGAVAGGRVIADWPGLGHRQLHEGRDLAATLDLRALFAATLMEHLGADAAQVHRQVFPGLGRMNAEEFRGLLKV